jgi:hypothetical protein
VSKVKVDGKYYEKGTEPDLGSIQCISDENSPRREYFGYVQDKDKLPKYDDLATGSSAKLVDPNGVEKTIIANYDAQTKRWINLKGGVIV